LYTAVPCFAPSNNNCHLNKINLVVVLIQINLVDPKANRAQPLLKLFPALFLLSRPLKTVRVSKVLFPRLPWHVHLMYDA
jgi:hypothetical protein